MEAIRRARLEAQAQIRALNTKCNIGRKISAVGLALIVFPDPFSDVVGVPMLFLGELINRVYSSLTIKDLMEEARSTLEALEEAGRIPLRS